MAGSAIYRVAENQAVNSTSADMFVPGGHYFLFVDGSFNAAGNISMYMRTPQGNAVTAPVVPGYNFTDVGTSSVYIPSATYFVVNDSQVSNVYVYFIKIAD